MEQIKNKTVVDYYHKSDPVLLDSIADDMAINIAANVSRPKVIVTVPAHNEESCIANCLESLADQRSVFGMGVNAKDFEILVLCHNCTDSTFAIACNFKRNHKNLKVIVLKTDRPEVNNIGAVRRILMRIASSRISSVKGYIAMTDADTVMHPYWMANVLGYFGSGYGLICGRIQIDREGILKKANKTLTLKRRYDELREHLENSMVRYVSDPAPKHSDNSGPNMAVRADVYHGVGGMPPIGFCEDISFYDSVLWGGHTIRHCPLTIVTTSGRVDPRAPWGFGAELRTWGEAGKAHCEVEGIEALLQRYGVYTRIHDYLECSKESILIEIGILSGIEMHILQRYTTEFGSYRAIVHKVEKILDTSERWRKKYPKKSVSVACSELEAYFLTASVDLLQT